jgi:hypothetical protein
MSLILLRVSGEDAIPENVASVEEIIKNLNENLKGRTLDQTKASLSVINYNQRENFVDKIRKVNNEMVNAYKKLAIPVKTAKQLAASAVKDHMKQIFTTESMQQKLSVEVANIDELILNFESVLTILKKN